MLFDKRMLLFYGITPTKMPEEDLLKGIEESLQGGLTLLQIRFKDSEIHNPISLAKQIVELGHSYGIPVIVNDDLALCQAAGADGVHLGEDDMAIAQARSLLGPDKIIGATAKSLERALKAQDEGADYLGIGALYPSKTKKQAKGISFDKLRALIGAVQIPVVAIGGLNLANISSLRDTGVSGAALVNAIFAADDTKQASLDLKKKLEDTLSLKPVLSIAGSDSSGGAGIQADIKAMMANGVYAMTAITSLTAQNTRGVRAVQDASPEFLSQQLDAIFEDIYPHAIKVGMVSTSELIQVIASKLKKYQAKNIVVDPVMGATSGASLLKSDALKALTEELIPLAKVITPNIPEAEILAQMPINSPHDMEKAAEKLGQNYGCAVLIKGGHGKNDANDILYQGQDIIWFKGNKIDNPNTHGTGCTLSSAIAANLAKGYSLFEAIDRAKSYLTAAIADQLDLGYASGPLNHGYNILGHYDKNGRSVQYEIQ